MKQMSLPREEPVIAVGLVEDAEQILFEIAGTYRLYDRNVASGPYEAHAEKEHITLIHNHETRLTSRNRLPFISEPSGGSSFTIRDIPIGRDFHWQRLQNQKFQGDICFESFAPGRITAVNRIPLELYLQSVICSEMSPQSPEEFLKAHCVISRSWLLAQIQKKNETSEGHAAPEDQCWTDCMAHRHFDVCADDHCQRYHGISRVNAAALQALADTRGEVLVYDTMICDARFSKCCGGISEKFSTAWEDRDFPYLVPVADCPEDSQTFSPPLSGEGEAERFIRSQPEAYCNLSDRDLLTRILPDFDFETQGFFRWEVMLGQEELQQLLSLKTGIDFGVVRALVPLARGASGRIYALKVIGTKAEKVFAKELVIRRILSPSHLYSSAFIVETFEEQHGVPKRFKLTGAGWGHGVGLCQIGAAAMAARGTCYKDILRHYFRGATLQKLY